MCAGRQLERLYDVHMSIATAAEVRAEQLYLLPSTL